MSAAKKRYETVEDYFASLDAVKARTLRAMTHLILTEFPELEAKISWNVPQIVQPGGKYVFGMSALKNHLSLAPWSPAVMQALRARIEGRYVVKSNLFQVPVDWEIDAELVKDLVRARLAELEG